MTYETRTLPAYWASYLINEDDSGLLDGEKLEVDNYLAREKLPFPVSCSEEESFQCGNDANSLGGDVLEYQFLIDEGSSAATPTGDRTSRRNRPS